LTTAQTLEDGEEVRTIPDELREAVSSAVCGVAMVPVSVLERAKQEIEQLRLALTDAMEVGGHLMSSSSYERARALRDRA
jgi:hypothetical protein